MSFRGKVVTKQVGAGSKSEHQAVVLLTGERELILRRQGGNPFADPELDQLVGSTIVCEGTVHGATLIMISWRREVAR